MSENNSPFASIHSFNAHRSTLEISMVIRSSTEESEIIELAWQDNTSFDSIRIQTGLTEAEVKKLMR